jgi:ADP-ribose pyrophosphatase
MNPPEVIASETVYRSRVFDVERRRVRFDDGAEVDYSVVAHPGAVAIVALDEQGRWLLVRQYRAAVGQELLEIPAGTLEPGEDPLATAHRELREETGYAAADMHELGGTWMAPGFCNEFIRYYLATGLTRSPLHADADERLSDPIAMTLDEVLAAIADASVADAKTVVATALYRAHIEGRGGKVGAQTDA